MISLSITSHKCFPTTPGDLPTLVDGRIPRQLFVMRDLHHSLAMETGTETETAGITEEGTVIDQVTVTGVTTEVVMKASNGATKAMMLLFPGDQREAGHQMMEAGVRKLTLQSNFVACNRKTCPTLTHDFRCRI